ncbi:MULTISPECIES: TDT family transporter [Streptococcus]|uniref:TDT family transporter n=1 Tax=Streptococcus caledonicus TaxID=2614158 RepID=A0ABW0UBA7_9STRE|nr:TDT family transporter [Streptococcus sp. S784/96/1]
MKLQRAPLATAGLILGILGLGNLIKEISIYLTALCGIIASLLFFYLIYSMLIDRQSIKKQWQNPLVQSVFTTFFMSGLLALTYVKQFFGNHDLIVRFLKSFWFIWLITLVIHMLLFSRKYLKSLSLTNVFPSWTVLYVGIGVASLTSPLSQQFFLGKVIVSYSIVATILVLPLIFYRLKNHPLETTLKPNTATICAPFSLVTAAYLSSFETPNKLILGILVVVSQLFYFYILLQLPKLLNHPFTPAFSAFTFPLVISATALKSSVKILVSPEPIIWQILVVFEIMVATLIVSYVLIGYLGFFIGKKLR